MKSDFRVSDAQPASPVQAILFDLGGVLIEVDFEKALAHWGRCANTEIALLRSRFSIDAFYEAHERGDIAADAYFSSLRSSLGIDLPKAEFEAGWNAVLGSEISATCALLPLLRQRFPLYLFSNSNPTHHRHWQQSCAGMLSHFERIFVSSSIGRRKPDVEAFLHVAREIGMAPRHILFFDDALENIDGALRAGFQAVHAQSARCVQDALARLLL